MANINYRFYDKAGQWKDFHDRYFTIKVDSMLVGLIVLEDGHCHIDFLRRDDNPPAHLRHSLITHWQWVRLTRNFPTSRTAKRYFDNNYETLHNKYTLPKAKMTRNKRSKLVRTTKPKMTRTKTFKRLKRTK